MALSTAQAKAFGEGDYYWAYDGRWGFPERPRPNSVDELWEDPVIQELMTHSVLDMNGVSRAGEEPDILHAAPLEVAPDLVELEVTVPHLRPAWW